MERPALFIYTPRCIDEESKTPLSPTSSLRGVFSASRPASYSPSECPTIASECPTISRSASESSDYSSDVSAPATSTTHDALYVPSKSTPKPQNTEPPFTVDKSRFASSRSEIKASSSLVGEPFLSRTAHTLLQKKSTTPKFKAQSVETSVVASIPSSGLEHPEHFLPSAPEKSKHRSWDALRRSVSHIFHRHPKGNKEKNPPLISSPRALKPSKSESIELQSSSASMFTQRSRRSAKRLTITPPPRVFHEQQVQARARKQRVRRSRSFSGYPHVLAAVSNGSLGVDTDAGLGDATMETQTVMETVQRKRA